jgi:hypothetical protein
MTASSPKLLVYLVSLFGPYGRDGRSWQGNPDALRQAELGYHEFRLFQGRWSKWSLYSEAATAIAILSIR